MKLLNAFQKHWTQPQRKNRHATKPRRRGGRAGSLACEPLEHRVLLSATAPGTESATDGSLAAQVAPDLIAEPIQPRTFVVNSTADHPDVNPGDGACDIDGNPFTDSCTLRAAIMEANASGNLLFPDRIEFDFPSTTEPTIRPNSLLPTITDPVVIDATTQPGYVDKPLVQLDGTYVSFLPGLYITAGRTAVRGLAINRYYVGVQLEGGGGNSIQGNYIGTNLQGTGFYVGYDDGNQLDMANGIVIQDSANNVIGGAFQGQGNLISGSVAPTELVAGVFIIGEDSTGNSVLGNFIGTNAAGTGAVANTVGVLIDGADYNTIGGTTTAERNVISSNNEAGVLLSDASGNTVQGNYIGPDPAGRARPNKVGGWSNGVGVVIAGLSDNNTIGGTVAGSGNVISANENGGIVITGGLARNNLVQRNRIGITDGFPSVLPNGSHGVLIHDNARDNSIGGAADAANIIAGNHGDGVRIQGAPGSLVGGNRVQGNQIGNFGGVYLRPNDGNGVRIIDAYFNTIGGDQDGLGNIISGNANEQVAIVGVHAHDNAVQGNIIGTDWMGQIPLGGTSGGVLIDGARRNLIGGDSEAARNLISGNDAFGLLISGFTATENVVQGNYIGTSADGTKPVANVGSGVVIQNGAAENVIGGTSDAARNVVSGNDQSGVMLGPANVFADDPAGPGNRVEGNYIGTTAAGDAPLGNTLHGVVIPKAFVTADGTAAAANTLIARNVISDNSTGIQISSFGADPSTGIEIKGNYVGTTANGSAALGNYRGIDVDGAENILIGGTIAEDRNVVSGNQEIGVLLRGDTTASRVIGNYIGADAGGMTDVGNAGPGVELENAPGNTIGGGLAGEGNVIAGNGASGVFLFDAGSEQNVVQGNRIGLAADGSPLPNDSHGVLIKNASNNTIGGFLPGEGNTIAFNGADGVAIVEDNVEADGNAILQNAIFDNVGLGIDLDDDGVTPNDAADADLGANNLQSFPVLSSAASDGARVAIDGSLQSTANTSFRVEFFSNTLLDPTGFGEGEVLLGAVDVTTDAAGVAALSVIFDVAVPASQFVTATATNLATNDTSEFSAGVSVVAAPPLTANAMLVRKLYRQVLGRDPEMAGWQYWAEKIAAGKASLGTIAAGIFESNERIDPVITGLYRDYLNREPESAGLQFWRGVWRGDGSPDRVAAGIVSSPEFFGRVGGTNDAWVRELYRRMLAREPDAPGLAYWSERLASGQRTRQQVVLGFLHSDENFRNLADQYYQQYLNRPATRQEQDGVVAALRGGASQRDVQIDILDSPEYAGAPVA